MRHHAPFYMWGLDVVGANTMRHHAPFYMWGLDGVIANTMRHHAALILLADSSIFAVAL